MKYIVETQFKIDDIVKLVALSFAGNKNIKIGTLGKIVQINAQIVDDDCVFINYTIYFHENDLEMVCHTYQLELVI